MEIQKISAEPDPVEDQFINTNNVNVNKNEQREAIQMELDIGERNEKIFLSFAVGL